MAAGENPGLPQARRNAYLTKHVNDGKSARQSRMRQTSKRRQNSNAGNAPRHTGVPGFTGERYHDNDTTRTPGGPKYARSNAQSFNPSAQSRNTTSIQGALSGKTMDMRENTARPTVRKSDTPGTPGSNPGPASNTTSTPNDARSKALACPECGCTRLYRDGLRILADGKTVQRWLCRNCGFRFSEPTELKVKVNVAGKLGETPNSMIDLSNFQPGNGFSLKQRLNDPALPLSEDIGSQGLHAQSIPTVAKVLNTFYPNSRERQVCASEGEAKNLAEVESRTEKQAAGATKPDEATAKGKIVEFLWYLKNNGYSDATMRTYRKFLTQLSQLGADLLNPESVKEVIAKQETWSENTKLHMTNAYNTFLENCLDVKWKPPRYRKQEKIPFVPMEEEIDQLIAGSGKKLSTFLQLLKETGMRCGEAIRLEWTDIDFKTNVVRVEAEKGSLPRILPVSSRLAAMLESLPKTSMRIWPGAMNTMRANLQITRARLARKLNNPRLRRINFHSLRHWRGTMEYHKTKDVIHVQQLLGHRAIKSTMLYINIENAIYSQGKTEEFHVKVAHSLDEACRLLEVGFEYVTDMDGAKIFRKRK